MGHEIIYTSARKGLRPGSTGYCIVAASDGIPPNLLNHFEKLTGYEHLFDAKSREASSNPVAFVHFSVHIGGKRQHILGRVSNAPLDYSSRSNLIAHLAAFDDRELAGFDNPAQALQQIRWVTEWDANREPKTLPPHEQLALNPQPAPKPAPCAAWRDVAGHAGWGGVLAESLADRQYRQAAVIVSRDSLLRSCDPGRHLHLIEESLRLLPPGERWNVGFSTYYTANLPLGIRCDWQFVIGGTPLAERLRRDPKTLSIDLTRPLPAPTGGALVQFAEQGGALPWQRDVRTPVRRQASDLPPLDEQPPPRLPAGRPVVADDEYGLPTLDVPAAHAPRRGRRKRVRKSERTSRLVSIFCALSFVVVLLIGAIAWQSWGHSGAGNPVGDQPIRPSPSESVVADSEARPAGAQRATPRSESRPPARTDHPPPTVRPIAPAGAVSAADQPPSGGAPSPGKGSTGTPVLSGLPQSDPATASGARATGTGVEPSQPEPPAEKPFDEIRRQHQVLDIQKPNRGQDLRTTAGDFTKSSHSLAQILIKTGESLSLEIIGAKQFIGDEVIVEASENGHLWQLRRKGDGFRQLPKLGQFQLSDGRLRFEWGGDNLKDFDLGLRNCLLKLVARGFRDEVVDEVVCTLRSPVVIQPIQLKGYRFLHDFARDLSGKDGGPHSTSHTLKIKLRWEGLEQVSSGCVLKPVVPAELGHPSPPQPCLELVDVDSTDGLSAYIDGQFAHDNGACRLELKKFMRRNQLQVHGETVEFLSTPPIRFRSTRPS